MKETQKTDVGGCDARGSFGEEPKPHPELNETARSLQFQNSGRTGIATAANI